MRCGSVNELVSLENAKIKTLEQHKEFEILNVSLSVIRIRVGATGKERRISFPGLHGAYEDLKRNGELTRINIEIKYNPRNPAYVAAILSKFDGVTYKLKPITLFYKIN